MARTIGKKHKNCIGKLCREAKGQGLEGINEIFEFVKDKLPEEVFHTWEGAYNEIENLCWDYAFERS